jgi:hypothetical protein
MRKHVVGAFENCRYHFSSSLTISRTLGLGYLTVDVQTDTRDCSEVDAVKEQREEGWHTGFKAQIGTLDAVHPNIFEPWETLHREQSLVEASTKSSWLLAEPKKMYTVFR